MGTVSADGAKMDIPRCGTTKGYLILSFVFGPKWTGVTERGNAHRLVPS